MSMRLKAVFSLAVVPVLAVAHAIAAAGERTPQQLEARDIYARIISIPSQKGNDKVPELAEYLAGKFRDAGFPQQDIHVLPFNGEGDNTASLIVRYRGS